jgi:hypothetical protein
VIVVLLADYGTQDDLLAQSAKKDAAAGVPAPSVTETKAILEEAFIYGFPLVLNYKVLHDTFIDASAHSYKGPFNQIHNEARVYTPKDTAVQTPNSDTPYSLLGADLRAEPLVLCMPEIEKGRYYSVQMVDMYTHNYGYIGSRTTGNGAGCYLLEGPDWKGETPPGIAKVFRCETPFSLVIFRTQLFSPADIENVKKVEAGYKVQTLSAFLKQPAPPAAPHIVDMLDDKIAIYIGTDRSMLRYFWDPQAKKLSADKS